MCTRTVRIVMPTLHALNLAEDLVFTHAAVDGLTAFAAEEGGFAAGFG